MLLRIIVMCIAWSCGTCSSALAQDVPEPLTRALGSERGFLTELKFVSRKDTRTGVVLGFPEALVPFANGGSQTARGSEWWNEDRSVRIATLAFQRTDKSFRIYYANMRKLKGRVFDDGLGETADLDERQKRFTLQGEFGTRRFVIHAENGRRGYRALEISFPGHLKEKFAPLVQAMIRSFEPFPEDARPPAVADAVYGSPNSQQPPTPPASSGRLPPADVGQAVPVSAGGRRVALVIGNNAYRHATQLRNAAADATDIGQILKAGGFEVISAIDTSKRELEDSLRRFTKQAEGANLALFFYSGHGLQDGRRNYLVPIDANVTEQSDLAWDTISLDLVLSQLESSVHNKIVLLDACRDNPFAAARSRRISRSTSGAPAVVERGLAPVNNAGSGTFIAFATEAGKIASDGADGNSPFTQALKRHITRRDMSISDIFTLVTKDVVSSTRGGQRPWVHSSLDQVIVLNPSVARQAQGDRN